LAETVDDEVVSDVIPALSVAGVVVVEPAQEPRHVVLDIVVIGDGVMDE
jgi:hypothetical protein